MTRKAMIVIYTVNDVSAPFAARLSKLWFPFISDIFRRDLCKMTFPHFLLFVIFNYDFIIYIDSTISQLQM